MNDSNDTQPEPEIEDTVLNVLPFSNNDLCRVVQIRDAELINSPGGYLR